MKKTPAEVTSKIFEELLDWVIFRRNELQNQKNGQGYSKPADIQSQQVLGGKIKAYQETIDKLQSLESKYLEDEDCLREKNPVGYVDL